MTRNNTRSKTARNLEAAADAVGPRGAGEDGSAALDPVEKVLLGAAPDDPVDVTAGVVPFIPDARVTRIEIVRSFLAEQPELRATLAQEVDEAWHRTGGRRAEFLAALAERQAEVLSRAELSQLQRQAPQAIVGFLSELSRYLVEREGFGAGSGVE